MRVLRGILAASRPLSWVNTAVPFALTYLLAQGEFSALLVVGFIFFLIPYNIAMYGMNDVFDYESDIVNPRKGGVEGAVLPKTMHRLRGHRARRPDDHAVRGRAVRSGGWAVLRATGPGVGCGTARPGIRGQYAEVLERH